MALYEIVDEARALSASLPKAAWYGFGSHFRGQPTYSDIDILVVCRTPAEAIAIRAKSAQICARWPLHLLIMTEDEAVETKFVATQGCERLW